MVTGQLHCPVETMAIMCVVIIMLITQMHSDFNEGDVCSSEDKIQAAGPWRDGEWRGGRLYYDLWNNHNAVW